MKKTVCLALACLLLLSVLPLTAGAGSTAKLYEIYGDGMLFQQNAEAVLGGTAAPGSVIRAVLTDADGTVLAAAQAETAADGTFAVSFPAPAGGYTEYAVALYENGAVFASLSRVVFGELWIAAGQSNMGYPYSQAAGYIPPEACRTEQKEWVRILLTPAIPPYLGSEDRQPALPQNDIPGSVWATANDAAAADCSAVAYWFAEDLAEALDVPVGILNVPLGGSSIISWLSRETVEGDAALLAHARADGFYKPLSQWDETGADVYHDATTMFNLKAAPLKNFRPAGMLWYQGENEVSYGWETGRYAHAFDLLQDSYTALFGREAPLPIVYTHLASYYYGDNESLTVRNLEFTAMQRARPDSRALITGYDFAPEYFDGPGAIHPRDKAHLGRRMSFAAQGLVYGLRTDYTVPTVKSSRIADGGVYVTLENVGDGLVCPEAALYGFSVADGAGVYVRAEAELVSADTVFVRSAAVPAPKSAAYACALSNDRANLYASEGGAPTLPSSPFITDPALRAQLWQSNAWTDCEQETAWHNLDRREKCGYFDTWTAENAAPVFTPAAAYSGAAGLRLTGEAKGLKKRFSASPVLTYRDGGTYGFVDDNESWAAYGGVSVMLRNNGETDVTLEGIRIVASPATVFYAAAADGSASAVIPADGAWHEAAFDLNALYLAGGRTGAVFTARSLKTVKSVKFLFSADGAFSVDLDDVRFAPAEGKAPVLRFGAVYTVFCQVLRTLKALFAAFGAAC